MDTKTGECKKAQDSIETLSKALRFDRQTTEAVIKYIVAKEREKCRNMPKF